MAVREIKTTIALDGEQEFRRALAAANKELQVSKSEMRAVAAAYELNGDKMQYLTNKQRILKDEIAQQESTVNALRSNLEHLEDNYKKAGTAVEDYRRKLAKAQDGGNQQEIDAAAAALKKAETAYETAGNKVNEFKIKVNNAETALNKTKRTLQDADREVEELGRDSVKVGRQIEEGIGESSEKAEKDVKSLIGTLKDDLSSIRASSTFTAIGSLWDMATGAYQAVESFTTGTLDYRRQLSYLLQNAGEQDWGMEETEAKLIEVQGMTGDAAAAIEGLSNLLQVDFPVETQFNRAMQALLGATVALPDTTNFEGLAEGFRQTIETGEAAGQLADVIDMIWGADGAEKVKSALAESETLEGDIEALLALLEGDGELATYYQEYREKNKDLIEEMESIARLEFQMARVGESLSRLLITPLREGWTDFVEWAADTLARLEEDPASALQSVGVDATGVLFDKGAQYVAAAMARLDGKTKEEAEAEAEKAGYWVKEILRRAKEAIDDDVSEDGVSEDGLSLPGTDVPVMLQKAVDAVLAAKTGVERVKQYRLTDGLPIPETEGGIWGKTIQAYTQQLRGYAENGREFAGTVMDSWNTYRENVRALIQEYEAAGQESANAYLDGWESVVIDPNAAKEAGHLVTGEPVTILPVEAYQEAGEEAGEELVKSFGEEISQAEKDALAAGEKAALSFGQGLSSRVSYVAGQAAALVAAAKAQYRSAMGGSYANVVLNLDGRKVAEGIAPYSNELMAVATVFD